MGCRTNDTHTRWDFYLPVPEERRFHRVLRVFKRMELYVHVYSSFTLVHNSNASSKFPSHSGQSSPCPGFSVSHTGFIVPFLTHSYCVSSIRVSILSFPSIQNLPRLDQSLAAGKWPCTFQRIMLPSYTIYMP